MVADGWFCVGWVVSVSEMFQRVAICFVCSVGVECCCCIRLCPSSCDERPNCQLTLKSLTGHSVSQPVHLVFPGPLSLFDDVGRVMCLTQPTARAEEVHVTQQPSVFPARGKWSGRLDSTAGGGHQSRSRTLQPQTMSCSEVGSDG